MWSVVQIHSSRPNIFIVTLILLTNDDGIEADGLRILEESLAGLGEIVVLAPDRERSAVSHGLTIRSELEARQIGPNRYSLDGTPADCVLYALKRLELHPDLLVSGINNGANLGEDIMYSGTVAAAREASWFDIPSVAISQAYEPLEPACFTQAGKFARRLVRTILEERYGRGVCLNVNIPPRRARGVRITRQGGARHFRHFNSLDRKGENMGAAGEVEGKRPEPNIPFDYDAVYDHFISVTPLQRDQTDYAAADLLRKDGTRLLRRFRIPGLGLIGRKS